jgi:hypothetical protein
MKKDIKILLLVITVLLFTFLLQGCSNSNNSTDHSASENNLGTPSEDPSTAVDESLPLNISFKVYSETVKDDDGSDLVSFRFSYPYIENPDGTEGIEEINNYYQRQLEHFISNVVPEGKKAALDAKKAAEEGSFDFFGLFFERESNIYYDENNLLSVLNISYEYTGGVHPMSYWSSETFDVRTGEMLTLSDIFGLSDEEALEKVYQLVISQIEEAKDKEGIYFDNYRENVKSYSETDFLLGPNGIIFYYQLYTIAPYAAGIPTFELPYDETELAIGILPAKPNDLEREVCLHAGWLIEANKDIFYNIFGLSMLPLELPEEIPAEQSLFPVKDKRFVTFSELDSYIRGVYLKSEADSLMNSGRYVDKDGRLHGDISKDTGMGYYIDWNNYRYKVTDIKENSANITIYVVDDSPAGREETTIEVKMLKENDRGLLERMFY